ncbi:MAG TPA: CRISPR-associated endonuclease Cas2 [Firmicutes bacterium]|mgnify:FL=1|nr:CRISPR-associated endonuclease Cas2 [Bacillota bacterium]
MNETSSYREMELLVIFDLPVGKKAERREYTKFRDFLLDDGFLMLQYSVYFRSCTNDSSADKHIGRVQAHKPKYGNVRIIKLTKNQFEKMIMIQGEKSEQEIIDKPDGLIVI